MASTKQDHDVRIEPAGALSTRGVRGQRRQAPSICTWVEGAVLCVVALFFVVTTVAELYRDPTTMTAGAELYTAATFPPVQGTSRVDRVAQATSLPARD